MTPSFASYFLLIPLLALLFGLFGYAIAMGRYGWGSYAVDRSVEPAKFRSYLCLNVLVVILLLIQASVEWTRHLRISDLMMGAFAGFFFVEALASGEALDPAFSRSHEPAQYWFLVIVLLALSIIFIGTFGRTLVTGAA